MEGIVTAVEPQPRRNGARINVYVDGRYAFSLQRELADLVRLGENISELRTAELLREDDHARALESALAFIALRPRSEREVRDRLRRRNVAEPITDSVVTRLKQLRYIDDEAFARYWVEQRQAHRPRGARRLSLELQQKGVAREIGARLVEDLESSEDPVDVACRAGERKALALGTLEARDFQRKLGQFLLRRGFDYETVRAACRRLWARARAE